MVLSVHNPTIKQLFFALFLLFSFGLGAFSQDTQPTLDAALAVTEPAARIEALQNFLQAQPNAPNADAARTELTRSLAMVGETQLAEKNIDAAIQTFKQAIAAFPKQVDDKFFEETAARIPLAVSVRGYRTEAILLGREMEVRFAQEAKRLAALGEFYMSLEAASEALRALGNAVKLAPEDARIYRALGSAQRLNLNLDDAATNYKKAIKFDPNDRRAYFELGNLQRARGTYEVAVNLYNHQLSIDPQHAASYKGLALADLALGKDKLAEEAFAQAAKITNADLRQDYYLQTQIAFAYLTRGSIAKARQGAETALAVESRYSWAQIVAAEIDLSEAKYFDAERHILAAMRYADFPYLHFTLGKIYLAVEDFDGAIEQFNKAFSYKAGKFQTRLGGSLDAKADNVAELLARERQASLFQAEPITTDIEFKLSETLTRFDEAVRKSKQTSAGTVSSMVLNQASNKLAVAEAEKSTNEFVETEGSRKSFRQLYAAERLLQGSQTADVALKLAEQALDLAETATASEGSLRDFPNYDRDGRLRVVKGRALTLRGRALLKLNRKDEAVKSLSEAVDIYGTIPERNRAQWHLAMAKESAGQKEEALKLYLVAYEPPDKNSGGADLNRAVIESLYRKIHGSLAGLDEQIGRARETALLAKSTPPPVETKAESPAPVTSEKTTVAAENAKPETPVPTETVTPPATVEATPKSDNTVAEKNPEPAPVITPAAKVEAPIELPETHLITLALVTEEMAQLEIPFALQADAEDPVPPPVIIVAAPVVAEVAKPAEENKVAVTSSPGAEENKPSETNKPAPEETVAAEKPVSLTPEIVLPKSPVVPYLLLPALEDYAVNLMALDSMLPEFEDVSPVEIAPPKTEVVTKAAPVSEPETAIETEAKKPVLKTKRELSDARVAELERAIESSTAAPGGKKGDLGTAVEASASGHVEGDAPVRIPVKSLAVELPAGDSGHAENGVKQGGITRENQPEALPLEIEKRASALGESSGKLSVGAALEIEAPEKPGGTGRKGLKDSEETQPATEPDKVKSVRPRRVKEN